VRAQFEKLDDKTLFSAFERREPGFPFRWHYHPEYELTLILDSHGQRLVGDGIADYGPGDLVLLGPNLPHSWRSHPFPGAGKRSHRAVVVHFRRDFVGPQFFQLSDMERVAGLLRRAKYGLGFGDSRTGRDAARKVAELPSLTAARRLVSLLSILVDLAEESKPQRLSANWVRPIGDLQEQKRIERVCQYLAEHFEEKINFAELSDEMQMGQTSLCRFFKRTTGRTMTTYANELRLGAASELLRGSEQTILDIAMKVGFENYSNFCRQFRKMKGCNPRTYRREFQRIIA
jgi:AraC-like DNA-binding protein